MAVQNSYFFSLFLSLYILIVIHRQTVSLYHDSSIGLETSDASSWNRNPADLTSVGYLTLQQLSFQRKRSNF